MSPSRSPEAPAQPSLAAVVTLYALARIGLLALVAGLLVIAGTPLLIAALIALVVALPLSMLVFRGLRARMEVGLAAARERRAAQRTTLRAGLRGDPADARGARADAAEPETGSGDRPEGQPDSGGDRPDRQEQAGLAEDADEPSPLRAAEHPPGHGDRLG